MKQMMIVMVMLTLGLVAGNVVETKTKKDSGINFILEKEFVMVYQNDQTKDTFSKMQSSALKNMLKKSTCSGKQVNDLVTNKDYVLKWIYIHKDSITLLEINDCSGVEITNK